MDDAGADAEGCQISTGGHQRITHLLEAKLSTHSAQALSLLYVQFVTKFLYKTSK